MEQNQVDALEVILGELAKARKQTVDIGRKASGPVLRLTRLFSGTLVPLLEQAVIELGNRAGLADLRLQRLEAHTRIVDDGDLLEGLSMEPMEFIASIVMLTEIARQAVTEDEPEKMELINTVQQTVLDWRDYLLEVTEEVDEDEDEDISEDGEVVTVSDVAVAANVVTLDVGSDSTSSRSGFITEGEEG